MTVEPDRSADPVADWLRALTVELELTDVALDEHATRTVLDLARDAAHQIERPAAPLTTFLAGVAVGRGAELDAVAARATALALDVEETSDPSV